VRQLQSTQRRAQPLTLFQQEAMSGGFLNEIGPVEARRAAAALAAILGREVQAADLLELVLACDGRPIAAEISAAVGEGLRLSGCTVMDAGFTTSGAMAGAVGRLHGAGGIYVGRGDGGPQQVSLSFFGRQATPLSLGGGLDELARLWEGGIPDAPGWSHSPRRRGSVRRRAGSLRRYQAEAALLAELTPQFHALRPLRLVLDTTSLPLRRQIARLAQRVALNITYCSGADDSLADRVRQTGAHFGLWIDGDGVRCQLLDEQGNEVPSERLTILLLRHFQQDSPEGPFVVDEGAFRAVHAALGRDVQLHAASATREGVARAMLQQGAVAAGGPGGCFYSSTPAPVACALRTLTLLLTIFSHSDAPVSAVCQ
jgi:phosphomannomutase